MKKVKIIFLLLAICSSLYGQTKKIAPDNEVQFKIKNSGLTVDGSFKGLMGSIVFDTKDLSKSSFSVNIDATTVHTGNNSRDGHLKKKEYFDVANFPKISFQSKKFDYTKSGFMVTGNLTIKGIVKEIKIPFTYTEKNYEGLFSGSFKINRLDYNVGESSWILSDEATILLNIKVTNQ
jgi:polyisoprenoid-binding protein YceI